MDLPKAAPVLHRTLIFPQFLLPRRQLAHCCLLRTFLRVLDHLSDVLTAPNPHAIDLNRRFRILLGSVIVLGLMPSRKHQCGPLDQIAYVENTEADDEPDWIRQVKGASNTELML